MKGKSSSFFPYIKQGDFRVARPAPGCSSSNSNSVESVSNSFDRGRMDYPQPNVSHVSVAEANHPIFLLFFCVIVCWCFKNWMIHDESIESLFGGRCVFFTMSTLECADGLFFNHLRVHLFQRHGDDHAAE